MRGTASTTTDELVRRSQDDPEWFWPRGDRGHGARVLAAVGARSPISRRARSGRPGSSAARLNRSPGTASTAGPSGRPRRRRRGLPGRGRRAARAHLRASSRDEVTRVAEGLVAPRRRAGRPRRDLHADVPRGRGRLARVRARGRDPGADLLRLRGAGGRAAAAGLRGEGRPLRRLVASPRQAPRHAARRWTRRSREAPSVEHVAARGRADDGHVGRARRRLTGRAAAARGRLRDAVPPHLHVRDDRQAEGDRPRAGRLPRLDRARGRLPGRRAARRRHPLRDRHGLDHGPVDRRRRRRARRDARLRGGRAGLAGRPALAHDRGASGSRSSAARRRSSARSCSTATPRPTSRRCARSSRPASRGTPRPTAGSSSGSAAAAARSSTARAGPRSARASSRPPRRRRSRSARSAGPRSAWRWTSSIPRAARWSARARSASSSAASRSPG